MDTRALVFDVFGTCVDWRGTIIREARRWSRDLGRPIDGETFTYAAGPAAGQTVRDRAALIEARRGRG